jgi:membrane-associated protein
MMAMITYLIDFILHIDVHLGQIIQSYGIWTYLILFLIVFCETGLVVTPFLPGDSLLFAAGAFAATGSLDPHWLFISLSIAAIIGDTANYWIGHYLGQKVYGFKDSIIFKREHLERTHRFYEKHGGKTIVIARFMPIIRTFAPFVAGVGSMSYWHFIAYNVGGGILWVASFIYSGFYFGNLPFVKKNFTLVIFAIIFLSILPGIIEYIRHRIQTAKYKKAGNL